MPITLRWLLILERIFWSILAVTSFYVIYFFVSHQKQGYTPERSASARTIQIKLPDTPPYEQYSSNIKKRDLFSSSINSSVFAGLPAEPGAAGSLPSNLKVVGIVLSKPVEVILEDTLTKQTIFIKQGQVQNGIGIDRVDGKQVTLNYQGQQIQIDLKENR